MREHIVAPFEAETGIETTLDVNLGKGWLANLRAAGPENPPYDVLMTNEAWASIEREEGFFEQIPASEVPNMNDVYPSMRLYDDMAVIGTLAPIGLCYRHDMVETVPTSWMDLWNVEEYRGRTGMYTITNSAGYMFVLLTGTMYHGSEYEVDKALDTIKELLPFNQVDFSGTMETVLTQGEAVIAPIDFPAGTRIRKKGRRGEHGCTQGRHVHVRPGVQCPQGQPKQGERIQVDRLHPTSGRAAEMGRALLLDAC